MLDKQGMSAYTGTVCLGIVCLLRGIEPLNKIVSVIIPMYNSEPYIEKCLDSLILDANYMQDVEIIVVNDGSTDHSTELVRPYVEQYPDTIRLISQENGGHGAAVDAGIDACQGKYFKVLDADDWFLTDGWKKFVHILLGIRTVDVIVSEYEQYHVQTGEMQLIGLPGEQSVETSTMEQFMHKWMDYRHVFSIHGMTYRTEFYRQYAVKLPQKVFYDDAMYITVAASRATTICVVNHPVYVYRVGDVNQSISNASRVARIEHMKIVIRAMCATEHEKRSEAGTSYWNYKVRSTITDFFVTAFLRFDDKKAGRSHARKFMRELRHTNPGVADAVWKRYVLLYWMSILGMDEERYQELLRNRK